MASYTCISADSHVFEPGNLWQEYTEMKFRDRAPRLVRQDGEDLIVAETGRPKVRMGETGSDFYAHALALQDRIRAADLSDAGRLEALAAASNQSAEETKARFA